MLVPRKLRERVLLNNRMAPQTPAKTFDLAALGGVVEPQKQEFNLAALGGVVEPQPQSQDSTLARGAKAVARGTKSLGSGVAGGLADTVTMPYNLATTMFNALKESKFAKDLDPASRAMLEAEGFYLGEPGSPDIPEIPSAVDAVDKVVDTITGGYTKTPDDEKSIHEGLKAVGSMASVGGAAKGAVKFGANKIGNVLEKFGSTKARDLAAGGIAIGVTSEALENKHGLPAAFGEGLGAGALATAALHPKIAGKAAKEIAQRTALKAFGLDAKKFNVEVYEALKKLGIEPPLNVVSDSKLLKAGLQFSEYLPSTSGKIIDQNKDVSNKIQSHFKKLSDDVGMPGDIQKKTKALYNKAIRKLTPNDKLNATELKKKASKLLAERKAAGAPIKEFQKVLNNYINKGEIPKADRPTARVAEHFENGGTLEDLVSKKDLPTLDRNYMNSFLNENPEHVAGFLKNGGSLKNLMKNTGTAKIKKYFKDNNLFEDPIVVEDVPKKMRDFLNKGGKYQDYPDEFVATVSSLVEDKIHLNAVSKFSSTLTGEQKYLQPKNEQLGNALREDLKKYDNDRGFQKKFRKAEDVFSANAERNKLDDLIGNKVTNPKTGDVNPGQLADVILGYGKKNRELKDIKKLDLKKLNSLGKAAQHIFKSQKNIPNPTGSGVYAVVASVLYALGVSPVTTIAKLGGLTGGMNWLLNPKTLDVAYNFAKNPSQGKAQQFNQLFKTQTGKNLAQIFGVASKENPEEKIN